MRSKLLVLFVPSYPIVGEIRSSFLNKDYEIVFPHEMAYDDYIASVINADLVIIDLTDGTKIGADVMKQAIENDVPFIITYSKYCGNVCYAGIDDLARQVKEKIDAL